MYLLIILAKKSENKKPIREGLGMGSDYFGRCCDALPIKLTNNNNNNNNNDNNNNNNNNKFL